MSHRALHVLKTTLRIAYLSPVTMLRNQVVFGYGFLILEAEKCRIQQHLNVFDDNLVGHIIHTIRNIDPPPTLYKLDYSDPMFLCLYRVVDDRITEKIDECYFKRITRDEMAVLEESMSRVATSVAALLDLDIQGIGWTGFQGS